LSKVSIIKLHNRKKAFNSHDLVKSIFDDNTKIHLKSVSLSDDIIKAIMAIVDCYKKGKKVILFGNGGSAADAQHIAAEFVGHFSSDRRALPAIALTTDTSVLTAISNDFGFDKIFYRQCDALVKEGDIVIAISTSGSSTNVIKGVQKAKEKKAITIALTGKKGGKLKDIADISVIVPSNNTQRIQEVHTTIGHIICELVEKNI